MIPVFISPARHFHLPCARLGFDESPSSEAFRIPTSILSAHISYDRNAASRSLELDILRGLALVLVLGRHILWTPTSADSLFVQFILLWKKSGWIGVDLFFVLSGFLVGGLLIREAKTTGHIQIGRFLIRRGLKIYPSFYVFLIGSIAAIQFMGLQLQGWPKGIWSEVIFAQNYFGGLWPHTWSLAVEEHFYFVWVVLLSVLFRRSGLGAFKRLPWIIVGVNVLILCGRSFFALKAGEPWFHFFFQTHWRLDSLLFGVYIAYAYHVHRSSLENWRLRLRPWRWIGWPLLLLPPFIFTLETTPLIYSWGLTGLYLGFGWIVVDCLMSESARARTTLGYLSFLASIGRASYSIYLWHVLVYYGVVAMGLRRFLPSVAFFADVVVYIGVAVLWGLLMHRLVESPVLRWRDRQIPRA